MRECGKEDVAHSAAQIQAAPREPPQGLLGAGALQEQEHRAPALAAAAVTGAAALRDAGLHKHVRALQARGWSHRGANEGG